MTKDFKTKSKLRAMHGGNVQGEGGPTDDKVGPVMLSDEEYVLPADTADAIGRDKLDALRAATHDFKDKGKGSALRAKFEDGEDHLADGGSPWTVDRNGTVSQPGQRLALPAPPTGTAVQPYTPMAQNSASMGGQSANWNVNSQGVASRPGQFPSLPPPTATAPSSALSLPPPAPVTPPPAMGPVSNPNAGVAGAASAEAKAFQAAQGSQRALDAANSAARAATAGAAGGGVAVPGAMARMAGAAGGLVRGGAPLAGIGGAMQSFDDVNSGYRDQFAQSIGADNGNTMQAVGADALRTAGNIGDAMTFGLAGRLGRGIANLTGGAGFIDGFLSKSPQDQAKEAQMAALQPTQPAAASTAAPAEAAAQPNASLYSDQGAALPVQPGGYQSRRLSELGVPANVQNSQPLIDSSTKNTSRLLQTAGTDQYQNLGTYGGNANVYGRASDPSKPGRINDFTGVGEPTGGSGSGGALGDIRNLLRGGQGGGGQQGGGASAPSANAAQINKNFDAMLRDNSGKNRVNGLGWSERHGLAVENARNNALGEDARTQASIRNNEVSTQASRDNNAATNQAHLMGTLATAESASRTAAASARTNALKNELDARKYMDERGDKALDRQKEGMDRNTKELETAFTTNGPDGKPVVDHTAIGRFNEFLGSGAAVGAGGKPYMQLSPQEQAAARPEILNAFRVNEAMNNGGGWVGGGRTTNSPSQVNVRGAEFGDLFNGLGIGEYAQSKLRPGYSPKVVERQTDNKVRSVEALAGDDAERRKAILRSLTQGG